MTVIFYDKNRIHRQSKIYRKNICKMVTSNSAKIYIYHIFGQWSICHLRALLFIQFFFWRKRLNYTPDFIVCLFVRVRKIPLQNERTTMGYSRNLLALIIVEELIQNRKFGGPKCTVERFIQKESTWIFYSSTPNKMC